MPRKKRRRIIRGIVFLLILAGGACGVKYYLDNHASGETEMAVITDEVRYDSIKSVVEGSGLTRAKNSETITIATAGTVMDVLVSEGDQVTAGTPLFVIDSDAAKTAVDNARQNVQGYEKQLSALQKDIAGLNLAAGYPGKLMETVDLNPGDTINKGDKVAVLADDTQLRLTQYYSYAYEGDLYVGQTVDVSVPTLMSSIPGTVEAVHMVSRITPEGTKLFSADILVRNDGALTAKMAASATVTVGEETVYPYEAGELEYYRTGDLTSTVSGTVLSSTLVDYLQVTAGQVLVRIDGEDSEAELFKLQKSLDEARKTLEEAEKNLSLCSATASIDGTVIGLTIKPGDEVAAATAILTISDTSSIIVNATVDERNVGNVEVGMMVELDQWDTMAMGVVESISLASTQNNGVASYPMVIAVDNSGEESNVQINSYINYKLTASENDNCLVLPIQCVRTVSTEEGETATVVYIQSEERPENAMDGVVIDEVIPEGFWPVPVEIGISDNYNVEIRSGVEEGTVVFTQNQVSNSFGYGF
ncbi:MAG: HlyD family efflux transporter periplasmic adaptor subunit [Oscillibacter sp.]|nr:HlyD family efflux transporter periplasmic adaptor subunit [Oscillibacter sp.]